MKKLYFLAFLFLCTFLTIGTNTVWGETVTVEQKSFSEISGNVNDDVNISYIAEQGTAITAPAINHGVIRVYQNGGLFTISANNKVTISQVVLGSAMKTSVVYSIDNGTNSSAESITANGKLTISNLSATKIKFTCKGTDKNSRLYVNYIFVTYETGGSTSTYTVTYDGNGSTGGTVPAPVEYDKGATVTVAGNTGGLVKTGFDFAGWNTAANGSGTTYQGGATFAINANTTLYALWTAQSNKLSTPTNLKTTDITSNSAKLSWDAVPHATKYTVTYAETNSSAIKVDVTSTTYVLSGLPSEATYLWTVKAVGDATYEDSEESSTAEFTTLPTPYTITWSTPNGTSTTKVIPGDKVVLPATDPTSCSSTYTNFVGWFTEAAGSESNPSTAKPATQVTAATSPTGDATYYAVFSDATGGGTWNLVTDVASLAVDDRIIIAAKNAAVAISTTQNTNNRKNTPITKEGSTLSTPSVEVQIFTLENGTKPNTWAFNTGSGYIYAASSSANQLKTKTQKDDNGSWKITLGTSDSGSGATVEAQGTNSRNLLQYNSSSQLFSCYNSEQAEVVLYKQVSSATGYISFCNPYIKGTDNITVTSGKDIWVEAVTKLKVECQNLTRNSGGTTVSITAKSLTDGFYIKKSGDTGESTAANAPLSLVTNHGDDTYSTDLVVVYKPTQDNVTEEGKIALRVYQYYGSTDYATDTIIVRGRSLPAEFVLAAKTTNGWVALPADLGTSSTDAVKEPYTISVDDNAAPTKATSAPQSALYSAAIRSTVNAVPTGLRFTAGGKYLQGSTSTTTTNVWLSSTNSEQMQSWELHSSNLTDYFVRLRAAEEGRYLSYNATQGKIANYKQESRLRILPVEQTCMRYDAPNIRVHALISTSVTFVWEAIAGVTDYEYSLDGEKTWQTCSGSETLGTEVKWTLANLTSETKYTVYIRAKVADGKSNCSVSDSETFTTPTCDDVPVDLWVSPTANAATIMWSAKRQPLP